MDQPTPLNPNPPIPGHDPSPDPAPVPISVCLVSGPASASILPAGSDDPAESASDRSVSVGVSGAYSVGDTVIFRDPSHRWYGRMQVLIIKPFPGKEAEGDNAWVHFEHGAAGVNAIYPVADLCKCAP